MKVAITRAVSPRIAECELTWRAREPIDARRAAAEHEEYEAKLTAHGWTVVRAEEAPEHPDGVFVEDAAVVLDEIAVLARPGAASRRGEIESIARLLASRRPLARIEPPATLDGGDVFRLGRTLHVGVGGRTNRAGATSLRELVAPFGYSVVETAFTGCLHLKSAATPLGERLLLLDPACVDPRAFDATAIEIEIDPEEPSGANALLLGPGALLLPASAPRTRARLVTLGFTVETIDLAEMEKAEAGVTCCSILVE
ncbi:MAG TPA: dimethylargininase [Thermoanaerobaculia bacterium]|nr:dimethylargininase [Thermoanaerobaculia bacterium]